MGQKMRDRWSHPRPAFMDSEGGTYADPILAYLVELSEGVVDHAVITAFWEVETMRSEGIEVTRALAKHIFVNHIQYAEQEEVRKRDRLVTQRRARANKVAVGIEHKDETPRNRAALGAEADSDRSVYFIRWGSRIKIGTSSTPEIRARSLSISPEALLLVIPGSYSTEARIHQLLAEHRIPRTEWFHAHPEVIEFIERLADNRGVMDFAVW